MVTTLRSERFCVILPHRNASDHISIWVCNAVLQRLQHCSYGRLQHEKPEYVGFSNGNRLSLSTVHLFSRTQFWRTVCVDRHFVHQPADLSVAFSTQRGPGVASFASKGGAIRDEKMKSWIDLRK